ncbi:MAG: hypothetical protein HC810_00300 [Acaryochloridaceae cyanobacterium RL_2_7]|nr:hypothetical protein [Acaryochloridaceae cyanobacterium RL_2_7]
MPHWAGILNLRVLLPRACFFNPSQEDWNFDYEAIHRFGDIQISGDIRFGKAQDTLISSSSLIHPSGNIHLQGSLITLSNQRVESGTQELQPSFSFPTITDVVIDVSNRDPHVGGDLTINATQNSR